MHAILGPRQPSPKEQEEDGNCDRMESTLFARRAERSLGGASTIAAAAGILALKRLALMYLSRRLLKMQNWLHLNGLNCGTKDFMDNSIVPVRLFCFSVPLDYIEILTFIDFLSWADYLY
jgi:hypothetical protein